MLVGRFSARLAVRKDVAIIVQMLADDPLGKSRESYESGKSIDERYYSAFERISEDINNELIVIEDKPGEVIGTLQITYITTMTFGGGERAQLEAVRVKEGYRDQGLGSQMVAWAIERAKERGCRLAQLTTNKERPEAHHFYEKLGFIPSHIGMKIDFARGAVDFCPS